VEEYQYLYDSRLWDDVACVVFVVDVVVCFVVFKQDVPRAPPRNTPPAKAFEIPTNSFLALHWVDVCVIRISDVIPRW